MHPGALLDKDRVVVVSGDQIRQERLQVGAERVSKPVGGACVRALQADRL